MYIKLIKTLFIGNLRNTQNFARAAVMLLTALTTTGAWAQTTVSTGDELIGAINRGDENIQLTSNIQLDNYLDINGATMTIDLNGHSISRVHSNNKEGGHVIEVRNNGNLTLTSTANDYGVIMGGKAINGGAIYIQHGNKVSANHVIFQNNSAADHAGAIWNNGEFTATNCNFENNTAADVGAIYNAVESNVAGKVTLTNCTITGNTGSGGAGALANALGATEMTIDGCAITNNTASGHGGGIWNGGTLTVSNSSFTNNTANDVGAIYNAISSDGTKAGTATLTGSLFTGNVGTTGAGALANAEGNTVMTIEDCTIKSNTAGSNGGGIWNGGTLNMRGAVKVTDNKRASGSASNVFLKTGKVITVTGDLTGSSIGVDLENISGTFTKGWGRKDPTSIFTADFSDELSVGLDGDEACVTTRNPVFYVERSWDSTNKRVISTEKKIMGFKIDSGDIPREGEYKEVTNAPDGSPNEWFQLGGYSDIAEYYVVRGNVNRETIVVLGNDVHLILCEDATLTLTGGLKLEDDHKLYIHSQSYGVNMGRLMVTNKYKYAAGIGSAQHEQKEKAVGELIIHGGHIKVTGGELGAGIGSCARIKETTAEPLCNSVTVYGGYVEAIGGDNGAGIGGGAGYYDYGIDGGKFVLYDGTVIAQGGKYAAGLGGGGSWCKYIDKDGYGGYGNEVTVYGGTLTATGGKSGAGIGSGNITISGQKMSSQCGGTLTVHGGTVIATGGSEAAGIGGGYGCGGANVYVHSGTVLAYGGESGAGIGGGYTGKGFVFHISGGKVTAVGGEKASGIGGGDAGGGGGNAGAGGDVTINNGTVIAKAGNQGDLENRAIGPGYNSSKYGTLTIGNEMMVGAGNNGTVERIYNADERTNACWYRTYAEISPCTHNGATYTIDGTGANSTHTKHCSYCTKQFIAEEHDFDETGECSVCHFKGAVYTVTIYLPDADEDGIYTTDGVYNSTTYDMVEGTSFTLPGAPQDLHDMEFAGWLIGPMEGISSYKALASETLEEEGAPYTLDGNVTFIARYRDIAISLDDDRDNQEKLYTYSGRNASRVILTGRKLWKDGSWNTLCLPFDVVDADDTDGISFTGTTLEGADIRTLSSTNYSEGTLTLNFTGVGIVTSITAGKPYIVRWQSSASDYIESPEFTDVVIKQATTNIETEFADFVGTFSPMDIYTEEKTNLYLGADNILYYPWDDDMTSFTIGSCRAYFQLTNGLVAGEPVDPASGINNFVLNIGEEYSSVENIQSSINNPQSAGWYSLDGRKISGVPAQKGIYINNGKKMVIK